MRRELVAASVTIALAAASYALSIARRLELRNDLDSTVIVELQQYWPIDADYTEDDGIRRPGAWTSEHVAARVDGELLPGEVDTVDFEGPGWVVWEVRDYSTGRQRCEGEFDFAKQTSHSLVIDRARCGGLR